MKYRKRVFAMDECELRAALSLLMPDRDFAEASRQSMQEELVQWLLSEGLSARHEFLLYREDSPPNEEVWLLSRRTKGCPCCGDRTLPLQSGAASPSSVSPCPSPSRGRSPSPRPSAPSYNRTPAERMPAGDGTKIQSGVILGPTRGRKVYDSANGGASRTVASTAVIVSRVGGPRTAGPVSSRVAITEQPKPGQKIGGGQETQKKKSLGEECCVECGHFCVDVISSLK